MAVRGSGKVGQRKFLRVRAEITMTEDGLSARASILSPAQALALIK